MVLLRSLLLHPRRVTALLVAPALCLIAAVSPAGAAQGPKRDQVTGTGQGVFAVPFPPFSFPSQAHVNAKGGPTHAKGRVWGRFDTRPPVGYDVLIKVSVRCVNAVGNRAIVGGIITQENSPLPGVEPGKAILRKVIDNGPPGHGTPDRTGTGPLFDPPQPPLPLSCPAPRADETDIATGAVKKGNFVVKDRR
jgi:hypothetical protein